MNRVKRVALSVGALPLLALGLIATQSALSATDGAPRTARAQAAAANPGQLNQVVGLRRLSESQYRNSLADIFGPDINVVGRFEPVVRPTHQLLAVGAANSTISPTGLEQFDAMARMVATQVFDETHRATFVKCAPANPAQADDDCAGKVLTPIGRYLFRRPLTAAEQAGYVQMANIATSKAGDFYSGLQLALGAMLVSPNFLYVIESAEVDPDHPGGLRLDNYSRASRLSYLLWNTTPDAALLAAAERGELSNPAKLSAVAARMVKSPRLEAGTRAFFEDMLIFEKFDDIAKDPIVYPRFNQDVARALPEQMLRMITDALIVRGDDYRNLFTTRHTFVNRALGQIYNVPVRSRTGWEPYDFAPNDEHAGLLSQAGFLALYSHAGRSSATLRGRAIRELLLCQPVPDPPANVNFSVVQDTSNKAFPTARSRLSAHATNPVCAACHRITDPIGLTLEGFDGIGVARTQENDADIDTSATMDGASFTGASGLGKALAANPSTTQCVASRMLEYATGKPTDSDAATIDAVDKVFAAKKYNFPGLMFQIATLPQAYVVRTAPAGQVTMSNSLHSRTGAAR